MYDDHLSPKEFTDLLNETEEIGYDTIHDVIVGIHENESIYKYEVGKFKSPAVPLTSFQDKFCQEYKSPNLVKNICILAISPYNGSTKENQSVLCSRNASSIKDEVPAKKSCLWPLFSCDDGSCISHLFLCDGESNCPGGRDEIDCEICMMKDSVCLNNKAAGPDCIYPQSQFCRTSCHQINCTCHTLYEHQSPGGCIPYLYHESKNKIYSVYITNDMSNFVNVHVLAENRQNDSFGFNTPSIVLMEPQYH